MYNENELEKIRNDNFSKILGTIRSNKVCSASQIAESTSIGLTTVKKCIDEGVFENMILTEKTAASTGGRKAQLYALNADYQYYLMIITDNNNLICGIYDFNKKVVKEIKAAFAMNEYLVKVDEIIEKTIAEYPLGTVLLSVPCVIKNGVIIDWYYNNKLNNTDIKAYLSSKFNLNFIIYNDMKLSVYGAACNQKIFDKNLVTAQFGHNGIGVGEMVNGNVLDGASGFAGEVGYIQDIRKNIMSTSYLAKIIRSVIICINPQLIVFYNSDRQNNFKKIAEEATRGLPLYAIPKYIVSDRYFDDIKTGCFKLAEKNGFFKKGNLK